MIRLSLKHFCCINALKDLSESKGSHFVEQDPAGARSATKIYLKPKSYRTIVDSYCKHGKVHRKSAGKPFLAGSLDSRALSLWKSAADRYYFEFETVISCSGCREDLPLLWWACKVSNEQWGVERNVEHTFGYLSSVILVKTPKLPVILRNISNEYLDPQRPH